MADPAAGAAPRLALCGECDWLVRLPDRALGQRAHCPRCYHHLTGPARSGLQPLLAWLCAALILLALVFVFPFLGFSSHGVGHTMNFADTVGALVADDYGILAALLLATTVGLPGLYLIALLYLCLGARPGRRLPGAIAIARRIRPLEPWMMTDVFVVGVLVSLIKIISLADIQVHASFIAFCGYSLALIQAMRLIDWVRLWDSLVPPPQPPPGVTAGAPGHRQSVVACRACDTPFVAATPTACPRCGKHHRLRHINRLQWTWALLVTATIAYIPANTYPVLSTEQLGNTEPQTIVGGVLHLAASGDWPIAAIIFLASIVVPISKIIAMGWLCIMAAREKRPNASLTHTRAYRVTEKIGRWSMIDVFVVAVLATLVQAGSLISIQPGPGAIAFASVVVLTMIAALVFDTRLLWPNESHAHER
ncbi:paraquat-inducible protein A [Salinisphaera sp. SPP-AMP-43]|uniref:PqiA/YebS family transporter subunit n=1 Tax=Salinisphaera sp. SPP-AMP-43 TaxID=3121288 RepID=UPI003C6E5D31